MVRMKSMRSISLASFLAWMVFQFPLAASAELEANFAMGGQFGGDVYFDPPDRNLDADGGFYLKAGADYFFNKVLGVGAFLSHGRGDISGLDFDFFEFGFALKPRYTAENLVDDYDLLITPSFYIGYRLQTLKGAPGDDTGEGLGLNLGIDFRVRFPNNFAVFIEPGFISQPDGGSDDADVEFSPIGTFLVGVGYQF